MKAKTLQIPSRYNLKKKTIGNNFIKAPLLALQSGCKFQEVQFSTLTQKKSYKRALILIIANTISYIETFFHQQIPNFISAIFKYTTNDTF